MNISSMDFYDIQQRQRRQRLKDFHRKLKLLLTPADRGCLYAALESYHGDRDVAALLASLSSLLDTPVKADLLKDVRLFVPAPQIPRYDSLAPYHKMAHPWPDHHALYREPLTLQPAATAAYFQQPQSLRRAPSAVYNGDHVTAYTDHMTYPDPNYIPEYASLPIQRAHSSLSSKKSSTPVASTSRADDIYGTMSRAKRIIHGPHEQFSRDPGLQRIIHISRAPGAGVGFSIRGGSEHGLGIFVSEVDSTSPAARAGLQAGDNIQEVNSVSFASIASRSAVQVLTGADRLKLAVRRLGKVPGFKAAKEKTAWYCVHERRIIEGSLEDHGSLHRAGAAGNLGLAGNERRLNITVPSNRNRGNDGAASLGFNVRGGAEFGLGIYVSKLDEGGVSEQKGLKVGDQIVEVNGRSFEAIGHEDAVAFMRRQKQLVITVRDIGKYPAYKEIYAEYEWIDVHTGKVTHTRATGEIHSIPVVPDAVNGDSPHKHNVLLNQTSHNVLTEFPQDTQVFRSSSLDMSDTDSLSDVLVHMDPRGVKSTEHIKHKKKHKTPPTHPNDALYRAKSEPHLLGEDNWAFPRQHAGSHDDLLYAGKSTSSEASDESNGGQLELALDEHEGRTHEETVLRPHRQDVVMLERLSDSDSEASSNRAPRVTSVKSSKRGGGAVPSLAVRAMQQEARAAHPDLSRRHDDEERRRRETRALRQSLRGGGEAGRGDKNSSHGGSSSSSSSKPRSLKDRLFAGLSRGKSAGGKSGKKSRQPLSSVAFGDPGQPEVAAGSRGLDEAVHLKAFLTRLEQQAHGLGLSHDEADALMRHVHTYTSSSGSILGLLSPLLAILDTPEKALLLQAVRSVIRTSDQPQYDQHVDQHRMLIGTIASAGAATTKASQSSAPGKGSVKKGKAPPPPAQAVSTNASPHNVDSSNGRRLSNSVVYKAKTSELSSKLSPTLSEERAESSDKHQILAHQRRLSYERQLETNGHDTHKETNVHNHYEKDLIIDTDITTTIGTNHSRETDEAYESANQSTGTRSSSSNGNYSVRSGDSLYSPSAFSENGYGDSLGRQNRTRDGSSPHEAELGPVYETVEEATSEKSASQIKQTPVKPPRKHPPAAGNKSFLYPTESKAQYEDIVSSRDALNFQEEIDMGEGQVIQEHTSHPYMSTNGLSSHDEYKDNDEEDGEEEEEEDELQVPEDFRDEDDDEDEDDEGRMSPRSDISASSAATSRFGSYDINGGDSRPGSRLSSYQDDETRPSGGAKFRRMTSMEGRARPPVFSIPVGFGDDADYTEVGDEQSEGRREPPQFVPPPPPEEPPPSSQSTSPRSVTSSSPRSAYTTDPGSSPRQAASPPPSPVNSLRGARAKKIRQQLLPHTAMDPGGLSIAPALRDWSLDDDRTLATPSPAPSTSASRQVEETFDFLNSYGGLSARSTTTTSSRRSVTPTVEDYRNADVGMHAYEVNPDDVESFFSPADDIHVPAGAMKVMVSNQGKPLGIAISGGVDSRTQPTIKVREVYSNGVVAEEGTIKKGMELVSVDGYIMSGCTHSQAVDAIRTAFADKSKSSVVFVVK